MLARFPIPGFWVFQLFGFSKASCFQNSLATNFPTQPGSLWLPFSFSKWPPPYSRTRIIPPDFNGSPNRWVPFFQPHFHKKPSLARSNSPPQMLRGAHFGNTKIAPTLSTGPTFSEPRVPQDISPPFWAPFLPQFPRHQFGSSSKHVFHRFPPFGRQLSGFTRVNPHSMSCANFAGPFSKEEPFPSPLG